MMPLARAFALFALVLIVLTAPWPGFPRVAGAGLAVLGQCMWSHPWGGLDVGFHAKSSEDGGLLRMEIFPRSLAAPDGSGPIRNIELDAAGFWWLPSAFLAALILASPVCWRDRLMAFPPAMICLQGVLLSLLAVVIWREAGQIVPHNNFPLITDNILDLLTRAAPLVVWWVWMGSSLHRSWLAGWRP
jgi:hypothetical protein